MRMSVRGDLKKLAKDVERKHKKQIPFAVALALTDTAKDGKAAADRALPRRLDRPTRFTMNAIGVKGAKKSRLEAEVFVKDKQAEYLEWQIKGGVKRPKGKAIVVPKNIRLNKHGNIPGRGAGKLAKLRAKKNIFSGKVDGQPGLYQRYKRKPASMLVAYAKKVRYGVKYPFPRIVEGQVRKSFARNFRQAMYYAQKTSR